jgi:hypothetical protein
MVDFNKMEKEAQQCSIMEKKYGMRTIWTEIAAENRKRGPKQIYHTPIYHANGLTTMK